MENASAVKFGSGKETDAQRLEQRLKQVQYGKNTIGYDNYVSAVPR
jgi:histone RNA hairpin-binding protein